MHVILVNGKGVRPDGTFGKEMLDQIAMAKLAMAEDPSALLVLTGGVTRDGFPSEAQTALVHFPAELWGGRIRLEQQSLSTIENIVKTKLLLRMQGFVVTKVTVITSTVHGWRVKYQTIPNFWPEVASVVELRSVRHDSLQSLIDHTFCLVVGLIDPRDKVILPWVKRLRGIKV